MPISGSHGLTTGGPLVSRTGYPWCFGKGEDLPSNSHSEPGTRLRVREAYTAKPL